MIIKAITMDYEKLNVQVQAKL